MPCVVCQHCHGQISKDDGVAIRDGCSYHKKCDKCYVCSETNLKNAEVFKGVIFCFSCSQRIFQGCSSARRSKNGNRKAATRSTAKRRHKNIQKRGQDSTRHRHVNGVLELTRVAVSSSDTSDQAKTPKKLSNSLTLPKQVEEVDRVIYDASKDFKKNSAEIGITTEVTQELLRQMNCPVVNDINKKENKAPIHASNPKEKGDSRYNKTFICSDLRIAELGASTEIAHMALKRKSELPVIVRSENGVREKGSTLSFRGSNQDSDASEYDDDWIESKYSLDERDESSWLDKILGTIFKIPYRFFKNKVLNRSSLISVAMRKEGCGQETFCVTQNGVTQREQRTMGHDGQIDEIHDCVEGLIVCDRPSPPVIVSNRELLAKMRLLFREEIAEHQSRGVRRLYSTINRRRVPYKLGWLDLVAKVSEVITEANRPKVSIRQQIKEPSRCKHFRRSHSYRCMRANVMKRAGPTKSELAVFRNKLKSLLLPPAFIRNAIGYTNKAASVTSEACGSNPVHSTQ